VFRNGAQDVFCEEVGGCWSSTTCVNLRRQRVLYFNLITEIYESELQGYLTHNTGICLPNFFPECREFDSRWCKWDFNPFGRTVALESTQTLTKMSTRSVSRGGGEVAGSRFTTLPPSYADCL
jgi:hypothetical protein